MGTRFKWDMFITSFLPLWVSIVIISIWNTISDGMRSWNYNVIWKENLRVIIISNLIPLGLASVIVVFTTVSMVNINRFLKDKLSLIEKPKATIIRAKKANKLSSEFLLAYILPMIAFDFSDLQNVVLFAVYFFVLAILCIRNSNVYTNIFLEFKGYRMYECDIKCSVLNSDHEYRNSLVISKLDVTLPVNRGIEYWDFENYIYIDLRSVK